MRIRTADWNVREFNGKWKTLEVIAIFRVGNLVKMRRCRILDYNEVKGIRSDLLSSADGSTKEDMGIFMKTKYCSSNRLLIPDM